MVASEATQAAAKFVNKTILQCEFEAETELRVESRLVAQHGRDFTKLGEFKVEVVAVAISKAAGEEIVVVTQAEFLFICSARLILVAIIA